GGAIDVGAGRGHTARTARTERRGKDRTARRRRGRRRAANRERLRFFVLRAFRCGRRLADLARDHPPRVLALATRALDAHGALPRATPLPTLLAPLATLVVDALVGESARGPRHAARAEAAPPPAADEIVVR